MLVRLLQPIRQPLSHMRSDLVVSFAVAFTIMFVSFGPISSPATGLICG
jgi:divalent metal cation (Fe/Co/Zn/Cd) transporter